VMKKMTSKAQQKATAKYIAKSYDDIKIRAPKGKRDEYKTHAERKGIRLTGKKGSLNALVIELLEKDMQEEAETLEINLDEYQYRLAAENESK